MNAASSQADLGRLVSISHFVNEMLGLKDRLWYYRHVDDPGVPQRVYIGTKPMLILGECIAYRDQLAAAREPRPAPEPEPSAKVKRHPGRPAKRVDLKVNG